MIHNIERYIRVSGILVAVGLIIEAISLAWAHPTAFILFVAVGATCMAAGSLLFLYSVLSKTHEKTPQLH